MMTVIENIEKDIITLGEKWAAGEYLHGTVLLSGETGVGKEHIAKACAEAAGRRLLVIDLSAMAESVIESELFGHTRGAFTGATNVREGLLTSNEDVVILLDEVGKSPVRVQKKLLRVLAERTVRRVGANRQTGITAPIILAMSEDVNEAIDKGTLYPDILGRVSVHFHLPPLRERRDELPALIEGFTREFGAEIEESAYQWMLSHDWPRNIRQLQKMVEAAGALDGGKVTRARCIALAGEQPASTKVEPEQLEGLGKWERLAVRLTIEKGSFTAPEFELMSGLGRTHSWRVLNGAFEKNLLKRRMGKNRTWIYSLTSFHREQGSFHREQGSFHREQSPLTSNAANDSAKEVV